MPSRVCLSKREINVQIIVSKILKHLTFPPFFKLLEIMETEINTLKILNTSQDPKREINVFKSSEKK